MIGVLSVLVLILETLYYSAFMFYCKRDALGYKYMLMFGLVTVVGTVTGTDSLFAYLLFVVLMLLGLKYIVKSKVSLYDMLVIVIMIILKLAIELVMCMPLYTVFGNIYVVSVLVGWAKFILVALSKDLLYDMYKKMKDVWYQNNFYIRYIFGLLTFLYTIVACVFLIIEWI